MMIGKGAEAVLYKNEIFGMPVVVKERKEKGYRIRELDERIRKFRTKNEARIILKARERINVPLVYYVGKFEIWMEFLKGKLLRDILEKKRKREWYKKIGKILADLHNMQIAHGDFTPANIIVEKGKIWMIDFGLSCFSRDVEEYAIDLLLMKKSIGKKFDIFLEGYKAKRNWKEILERMEEIRKRARYVQREIKLT